MAASFGVAVMVVAAFAALRFVAYLVFLGFVIVRTGSTEGLRDVATAIRAYRVSLPGHGSGSQEPAIESDPLAEPEPAARPRIERDAA